MPSRRFQAIATAVFAVSAGGCGDAPAPRASEDRAAVTTPTARAAAAERDETTALIALEGQGAVAVVQGPRWRVVRRTRVAAGPHNLAPDPHGLAAAVTSPPSDRVTILEPSGRVRASVSVPGSPHDVRFTTDGKRLWVTAERGGQLVQVGARSGRVLRSIGVGGQPHDLAISRDGRRLWVTINGSGVVQERSARTGRLLASRRPGSAPHDVGFAPGGNEAWLSNWSSGLLTVANARSGRRLAAVNAGLEPHHFAFGRTTVWVTDNGAGTLVRIGRRSRNVLSRTRVGRAPHHVAVTGELALVAVNGTGRLVVVSARGRRQASVRVGRNPHGIATLAAARG